MDDLKLIERLAPQEAPDEATRHRAESLLAQAISEARPDIAGRRVHAHRRRRGFAVAGALVAAAVMATVLITVLSPAGGSGTQNAYAAVSNAGAATAAAARHSGRVVVDLTRGGSAYAGESVRWNNGNASVRCSGVGSCGRLLLVDRVLFTKAGGTWTLIDKGGLPQYMYQRYIGPALQSMSPSTFRRITRGMQDLKIHHAGNGTTIYTGREAAGVLTRNPDTGERIRVLPFGFVAQGKAADPAALLNVALTVGADGIIQRIAVDWGTGASAWTFTVAYSHLGRTAPLAAPAGPTTGATAS